MTRTPIFSSLRKDLALAVLAVAGATALAGCSSNDATYRPSPRYNTYGSPSTQPAPTPAPAPAPAPAPGGQMACGAGKCG